MATRTKVLAALGGLALLLAGAYLLLSERVSAPGSAPAGTESSERGGEPAAPTLAGAPKRPAPPRSTPPPAAGTPHFAKGVREGEPAGKGVIGGVVKDEDMHSLAGVEVLLWDEIGRSILQRSTTGPDGAFRFEVLDDGVHVLSVHRGKASVSFRGVRGGERLFEVTIEPAPVDPAAQITGVVVEQGTDRPVEGVSILARPQGPRASAREVYAKSAKDGTFALQDLSAGPWLLDVGRTFGPEAEYERRRVGPVEAGTTSLRVELARGLSISGEIRGPDGARWTGGATVRASPLSESGGVGYEWQRTVQAAADGTFRIPGLSRGPYDLTVETTVAGIGAGQAGVVVSQRVAAGTSGFVVGLVAGRAIVGQLLDETGAAVTVPGFVWVYEMGSSAGVPGSVAAKVGEGGKFTSTALDPGRAYTVRGMGFEGFGPGEVSGVHPGDGGVTVRLFRGRQISGRVVDAQGRPVPAFVPIVVAIEKPPEIVRPDDGSYMNGSTDAAGTFKIGGLQEGAYSLEAGGYSSGWVSVAALHGVLPSETPIVLRVERGVPLSGRLLDAKGEALAYVTVTAWAATATVAITACDADGRFKFAGVPKGSLSLGATVDGKHVNLGPCDAPADDLTLRLPK